MQNVCLSTISLRVIKKKKLNAEDRNDNFEIFIAKITRTGYGTIPQLCFHTNIFFSFSIYEEQNHTDHI